MTGREELDKAGVAETNRSLQHEDDRDKGYFSPNIIREVRLDTIRKPGESAAPVAKKKGQAAVAKVYPELLLHMQYQSWDLPKEYWDRQSFTEFMYRSGRKVTAKEGEEILAPGHSGQQLCVVVSGVINIQVQRRLICWYPCMQEAPSSS